MYPSIYTPAQGRGFEIAQGRLGPGRIHHCMRLIGQADRALEYHLRRVLTRSAFGSSLAAKGAMLKEVADSRIDLETSRLLTLQVRVYARVEVCVFVGGGGE